RLVEAGQQLASVEGHRPLQPPYPLGQVPRAGRGLEGLVELRHVGGEGSGIQLYGAPLGDQESPTRAFRVRQQGTAGMELEAEVAASLVEVSLGPEEIDEYLAGVRMLGVIGEVGQERRRLLAREREGGGVPPGQAELAEQLNVPTYFHPLPHWGSQAAGAPFA